MEVLVDTSIWSLVLRRSKGKISDVEQSLTNLLIDLVRDGRVRVIGPIRQELLSGIREAAQYEHVRTYLRAFADEPISTTDYEQAAQCSNQCRSQGITGSSVDFLICSIALARGWQIFTMDQDFRTYSKTIPIATYLA